MPGIFNPDIGEARRAGATYLPVAVSHLVICSGSHSRIVWNINIPEIRCVYYTTISCTVKNKIQW